jgi:MFS family permease
MAQLTDAIDLWMFSGRKKMAIAFGVLYSLSCMTKLSESFAVLMIGRLLSGISTSLLFSVFETWMIHEHHRVRTFFHRSRVTRAPLITHCFLHL